MNFLDSIDVAVPCSADWDDMIGGDRKRFCLGCSKYVYNLSAMSGRDAKKLVAKNAGKICVRYSRAQDGSVLTTDRKLHTITRGKIALATGVMAMSITVTSTAFSQSETGPGNDPNHSKPPTANSRSNRSSISIKVLDTQGEVIPSAQVVLTSRKTKIEFASITGPDGIARFTTLPRDHFDLQVSFRGFQRYTSTISVREPAEPTVNVVLSVATFTGLVSVDWSDIPLFQAIAQNDNDVVMKMITQGFKVNTRDSSGRTALHVAVEHENTEIIRFLLAHRADVNAKDRHGVTPIVLVGDGQPGLEIYRLLVDKGANVNVRNDDGETLLMLACEDDDLELVRFLLDAHADPNLRDEDGETAIQKTKSEAIKQLLRKHGAKSGI